MARVRPKPATPHDGERLFQRCTTNKALRKAWEKVEANRGASGGDGVTCTAFAALARQRISNLSRDLRDGSYLPGPVRRVEIPKDSGGVRGLSIPTVTDRVAQTAVAQVLSPLFEKEFEETSFGYRPGRGVRDALQQVHQARKKGYRWTVDADIEAYFDSVPHERMMERLLLSVSESPLTHLIALWLETSSEHGRGLPQGSPLSPLLANLYLDDLDEAMSGRGMRLVRYADDFVVLVKSEKAAEKALKKVRAVLAELGLNLHAQKTRIRDFDASLTFLGTVFMRSFVLRDHGSPFETQLDSLLRRIGDEDRALRASKAQDSLTREQQRKAGYLKDRRALYVHGAGHRLDASAHTLLVRGRGEVDPLAAIHAARLDRIEVGSDSGLSDEALRIALAHSVPLALVDGHGRMTGEVRAPLSQRGARHLAQARMVLDEEASVALARVFVTTRLHNQRALLRIYARRRKDAEISRIAVAVARHVRLAQKAETIDSLRGHEGAGTARYWRGLSACLLHGWQFHKRDRPAADPVNVVLNITASLLEREVSVAVGRADLHPGFGALHKTGDGREACVYDLMELFRTPIAESTTLEAFNTKMLRPEHFQTSNGTCRIISEGYRACLSMHEERMRGPIKSDLSGEMTSWRGLIEDHAFALAAHIDTGAPFTPHKQSS